MLIILSVDCPDLEGWGREGERAGSCSSLTLVDSCAVFIYDCHMAIFEYEA